MKTSAILKIAGFVLATSAMSLSSYAASLNLSVDFTNGKILTAEEKTSTDFGINGSNERVEASASDAVAVFKGFKYHSTEHGLNPGTMEIDVPGNVRISIGTCNWGSGVSVKNASGIEVATMNTSNGTCYHNDVVNNIVSCNYSGEATKLIISGGGYWPYLSIEQVEGENVSVAYSFGSYSDVLGSVPANATILKGGEYSFSSNKTMYHAGHTLTGWSNGTETYEVGKTYTINSDLALTPVFTKTPALSERTEATTAKWWFGMANDAPALAIEGKTGLLVTQALVDGVSIDVALMIDATAGKFYSNRGDKWAQVNNGTVFTVEAAKNCVISMEGYKAFSSTTIDGDNSYESSTIISYQFAGEGGNIDIVSGGETSYMSYIQIVYPEVASSVVSGEVKATWANKSGSDNSAEAVASLANAFSLTTHSIGEGLAVTATGADSEGVVLTKYQPLSDIAAGSQSIYKVTYSVTPSKGLKFTPKNVSFNAMRFGTDGGYVNVAYSVGDGEEIVVQSDFKPNRDKTPASVCSYEISDVNDIDKSFTLHLYIHSLGNTKQIGFSDIVIDGIIDGTLEPVEKYTLNTSVTPEDGGNVTVRPKSVQFDEGTEVKLIAERNFGYRFINWIDADTKNIISADAEMTVTIVSDMNIQAVFAPMNTYELIMNALGGANQYQVSASPAATTIDNRLMYEEGTTVTVNADSRPVMTFTNWASGETSSSVSFVMDDNKNVSANFEPADYIVGWDFHKSGNNGRVADFISSSDNESASLILRNAAGDNQGWLDKSTVAAGGYEGLPAAVNWKALADGYYYQIRFNAKDFTDIRVASKMLYNYNAYKTQKLEYSLDGENFTTLNTITFATSKEWTNLDATLPAEANHAENVYIRWIPDYESDVVGTPGNDGTGLAAIYVTASGEIYDDKKAPVVEGHVPAINATGASASGQIVLTFDKKIKVKEGVKATLNDKELTPSVTGKSITLPYTGLLYNTKYKFTMPANSISDLAGNILEESVTFEFTTMERTEVSKGMYDFVVDGSEGKTIVDAISAANNNTSGNRFRIFVKNGSHYLGEGITAISASNVSLIGESEDNTIIYNKPVVEGISVTATIQIASNTTNVYMQDITLKNAYDYAGTTGRAVALQDKGSKNIFKNIKLLSYQDTYYSNNNLMRAYFEDCEIHGTVDFICGGGDIVFKRNLLFLEDRTGNVITAPAGSTEWGYVFMDCTIDGYESNSSSYRLGRPWNGSPRSVFLNTTMKVLPAADGWTNMSQEIVPALFAEYKSVTASGTPVDCSQRRTEYTAGKVDYDPVLSDEDASKYTIENILAGSDQWIPTLATEQENALKISISENVIRWDDSKYALLYAIVRDGNVIDFTTESSYTIPSEVAGGVYSVRAANEMGGLGETSNAVSYGETGIEEVVAGTVVNTEYFSIDGIRLAAPAKGIHIVRITFDNGSVVTKKEFMK